MINRNPAHVPLCTAKTTLATFVLVVMTSASSMIAQNVDAPTWTAVMTSGQEVNYFKYYNSNATEIAQSAGFGGSSSSMQLQGTVRPHTSYTVLGGSGATRTVCGIVNQPSKPVYWWDGSTPLGDQTPLVFPTSPSNEFSVSRLETGLKGLEFKGAFEGAGSVSGTNSFIVETVYYSDRACTDAGIEYGFFRRLLPGSPGTDEIAFYYSDYTNCEGGFCKLQNNSGGTTQNPIVNEYIISGLTTGATYYWHAYPVWRSGSYKLRFEVIEPSPFQYATCQINGATAGNCALEITDASFDFSRINNSSGYVILGVQAAGTVSASTTFILDVEEAKVGK